MQGLNKYFGILLRKKLMMPGRESTNEQIVCKQSEINDCERETVVRYLASRKKNMLAVVAKNERSSQVSLWNYGLRTRIYLTPRQDDAFRIALNT